MMSRNDEELRGSSHRTKGHIEDKVSPKERVKEKDMEKH
jgi:hypothetical protein